MENGDVTTVLATTLEKTAKIEGDSTSTFSDHELTVVTTMFDKDTLQLVKNAKIDKSKINRGICDLCLGDHGKDFYRHLRKQHKLYPALVKRICTCTGSSCTVECLNKTTFLCQLYLRTAETELCGSCCEAISKSEGGYCNLVCQRDHEEYLDLTIRDFTKKDKKIFCIM